MSAMVAVLVFNPMFATALLVSAVLIFVKLLIALDFLQKIPQLAQVTVLVLLLIFAHAQVLTKVPSVIFLLLSQSLPKKLFLQM